MQTVEFTSGSAQAPPAALHFNWPEHSAASHTALFVQVPVTQLVQTPAQSTSSFAVTLAHAPPEQSWQVAQFEPHPPSFPSEPSPRFAQAEPVPLQLTPLQTALGHSFLRSSTEVCKPHVFTPVHLLQSPHSECTALNPHALTPLQTAHTPQAASSLGPVLAGQAVPLESGQVSAVSQVPASARQIVPTV